MCGLSTSSQSSRSLEIFSKILEIFDRLFLGNNVSTTLGHKGWRYSFCTHFASPHPCSAMLTKHFDLTQVCILLFSNIERGSEGAGTMFWYYGYNFIMFLPFSNTICPWLLCSFRTFSPAQHRCAIPSLHPSGERLGPSVITVPSSDLLLLSLVTVYKGKRVYKNAFLMSNKVKNIVSNIFICLIEENK